MSERLDALLAAPAVDADARWGELAADRSVVLYGAGGMGRRVLAALRRAGTEPVAFADRAPRTGRVDGLPVLGLEDAAARHGAEALFVVCVFNHAVRTADVIGALRGAGCECVTSLAPLAWALPEDLLPAYALDRPDRVGEQAGAIRAAYELLGDEPSRREYLDQVAWRLDGDYERFGAPEPGQYFAAGVVELRPDEVFLDAGAFDGDTVARFVARSGGRFRRLLALEPDPANLDTLERRVSEMADERIRVRPLALADRRGTLRFAGGAGGGSGLAADGDLEVEAVTLDALVAAGEPAPTYVKMDVEGAEPAALRGAAATIRAHRPALAVCVYHEQDHLWTIPLQVRELCGDGYRYLLRRHAADAWDVVLYALPPGRA